MRRLFKILIVVGVLFALPTGIAIYSTLFPWQYVLTNMNCRDINIPLRDLAVMKLVAGRNPVATGSNSTFSIPGIPASVTVVSDGVTDPAKISVYAVIAGIFYSEKYDIDVTQAQSVKVNGIEMIGTENEITLDSTTDIEVACNDLGEFRLPSI